MYLDKDLKKRECACFCAKCGAYLNAQHRFTAAFDNWCCSECGFVNDVYDVKLSYTDIDIDDSDDKFTF